MIEDGPRVQKHLERLPQGDNNGASEFLCNVVRKALR